MTTPDDETACPRCGAPLDGLPANLHWIRARAECDYAASLRRERDDARAWAEECETARDAEHTYASIVKAENESMRRVVEAAEAWFDGYLTPDLEERLVNAVDEHRKEQQDDDA